MIISDVLKILLSAFLVLIFIYYSVKIGTIAYFEGKNFKKHGRKNHVQENKENKEN
jgi:hypothetical protein